MRKVNFKIFVCILFISGCSEWNETLAQEIETQTYSENFEKQGYDILHLDDHRAEVS